MTNCTTRRNCITPGAVPIGCIDIPLIEGNYRAFTLTFRKIFNKDTPEEIIEILDLNDFQEIVMDIADPATGDIILIKEIDNGLEKIGNNILKIYFGKETFDLNLKKMKYDIYFITNDIVGNTYVEGHVTINKVVTKRIPV